MGCPSSDLGPILGGSDNRACSSGVIHTQIFSNIFKYSQRPLSPYPFFQIDERSKKISGPQKDPESLFKNFKN